MDFRRKELGVARTGSAAAVCVCGAAVTTELDVPNLSKAQAERAIPGIAAMRNIIESAAPPADVDLKAWSKIRESMLSQLDNQLRHAQIKLGRAERTLRQRPSQQGGFPERRGQRDIRDPRDRDLRDPRRRGPGPRY